MSRIKHWMISQKDDLIDYLGGCVFTLGQLMGAKGCTLAKKLAREKSYMIVFGDGKSKDCFYFIPMHYISNF